MDVTSPDHLRRTRQVIKLNPTVRLQRSWICDAHYRESHCTPPMRPAAMSDELRHMFDTSQSIRFAIRSVDGL